MDEAAIAPDSDTGMSFRRVFHDGGGECTHCVFLFFDRLSA